MVKKIENIKNLVASGNSTEALSHLLDLSINDKEINKLIWGIFSEQNRVKEYEIKGIVSFTEINTMHNILNSKILKLIDFFDDDGNIINHKRENVILEIVKMNKNFKIAALSTSVSSFFSWVFEKKFGVESERNDESFRQVLKLIVTIFLIVLVFASWKLYRVWISENSFLMKTLDTFITISYLWLLYYFFKVYLGGDPIVFQNIVAH